MNLLNQMCSDHLGPKNALHQEYVHYMHYPTQSQLVPNNLHMLPPIGTCFIFVVNQIKALP